MENRVSAEERLRDIKRKTRRKYCGEEKIRIILDGLRGEGSIAELYRREGISQNLYYKWSKDFLEAGKARLQGDTQRQANSQDVDGLCKENEQLKEMVARLKPPRPLKLALAPGGRTTPRTCRVVVPSVRRNDPRLPTWS